MAETQGKRQRDETLIATEELEEPKRRKSYNQILSFLDEEDQDDADSNPDVSSIFTTLQRELSFDDPIVAANDLATPPGSGGCPGSDLGSAAIGKGEEELEDDEEEEEEEDRLMKRLLEATDDELGIPNGGPPAVNAQDDGNGNCNGNGGLVMDGGDEFGLLSSCGGLWELEDEAANYYTWFQSELFM